MNIIAEHLAKNGKTYYFADDRKIYRKDENGKMVVIDLKAKDLTEEAIALKNELKPGRTDVVEEKIIEENDTDEIDR